MKTKINFIIGSIVVILIFSWSSFAQESKISVGLDYGSSIIQPSTSVILYTSGFRQQIINWAGVPNRFRGIVGFSLHSHILLRGSVGYGSTRDKDKFQSTNSAKIELEHQLSGIPAELAIIFHAPIGNREKFNILFGLGAGFYSYKLKTKYVNEGFLSSDPETKVPDVKFSGLAQTFIFGFSIRPLERLGITVEFAKLGLSAIKEKQDLLDSEIPLQKIGESEKNYNAAPGLKDLTMTLGVNFHR